MNTHLLLLGLLLCLAAVNARHFESEQPKEDSEVKNNNHNAGHRRKRYHINYGYDYPPPVNPFNPYDRRDYDRNQQDLLPQIYRLLDEISAYVRRPPPPPQPIYIPYAVPYPICNCPSVATPQKPVTPNVTNRWPIMDDSNQNWGLIDDGVPDEEGDGSRPVSFTPIQPKRPLTRPAIPVEHGSQFASSSQHSEGRVPSVPSMCDVFSLSCCAESPAEQKKCFINAGCPNTYDNGKGCSTDRLQSIIDAYSKAYAPVN